MGKRCRVGSALCSVGRWANGKKKRKAGCRAPKAGRACVSPAGQPRPVLTTSAPQDSSDDVRKVQRREKNRIAAQKSRQRQTQKADTLHLVSVQASLHPWAAVPLAARAPCRPPVDAGPEP